MIGADTERELIWQHVTPPPRRNRKPWWIPRWLWQQIRWQATMRRGWDR